MRLSVASNFDNELVHQLCKFPVHEIYGKLSSDYIGGGRSAYMINFISKRRFSRHVQFTRSCGIGFNYLLNAANLNNNETTRQGQKQIRCLLDWICHIGANAVTVANPLLLKVIKSKYPQLKVRISVFACVDHVRKAKYWEEEGADVICLDSLTVNRDFQALKAIRKSIKCELELLVNNNCLQSCSLAHTHMNLLANSSQSKNPNKGFVIDYCMLTCGKEKVKDPVNYIRSDWIRPDDIQHYEKIGYNNFKIVERNLRTSLMIKRVKAYSERKYEGNLIDLIQPYGHAKKGHQDNRDSGALRRLKFLYRPLKVNPLRLKGIYDLCERKGMLSPVEGKSPVIIDNRKLHGFLQRFMNTSCRNADCDKCLYCHDYAEKAITVDPEYKRDCAGLHDRIEDALKSGSMWRY